MKDLKDKTTFEPKSLFLISQEILTKNLDALYEIGAVPYEFIEQSLKYATAEQLQRIEKCNPKIKQESNELWLAHCLLFPDVKDEYNKLGLHRDRKRWRGLYRKRYEENEFKKESVKRKIREKYNIINNEKAAKSIKVIKGILPMKRRPYEEARKSNMSPLFQRSRKETSKVASIYNTNQRRPAQPYLLPAARATPASTSPTGASTGASTAISRLTPSRPVPSRPTTARPNITNTAVRSSTTRPTMTRPSISTSRPRPILNRPIPPIQNTVTNQGATTHHVAAKPTVSRPTQYLRTLPIPSAATLKHVQPRKPVQTTTRQASSVTQYKISKDRYSQPFQGEHWNNGLGKRKSIPN